MQPTHHGFAVNVKDRDLYHYLDRGHLSEDEVQAIYEMAREGFWSDVQVIGERHGFRRVYSEGRSGGWAVGFLSTMDEPAPEYLARFAAFKRDVRELVDATRRDFRSMVEDAAGRAKREPVERAEMEARDIVTVD